MSMHFGRQLAAAFALAVLATTTLNAQAACKGQPQDACTAEASCTWVKGYERRDGTEVAGYCRTRSGGGTSARQPVGTAQDGQG